MKICLLLCSNWRKVAILGNFLGGSDSGKWQQQLISKEGGTRATKTEGDVVGEGSDSLGQNDNVVSFFRRFHLLHTFVELEGSSVSEDEVLLVVVGVVRARDAPVAIVGGGGAVGHCTHGENESFLRMILAPQTATLSMSTFLDLTAKLLLDARTYF